MPLLTLAVAATAVVTYNHAPPAVADVVIYVYAFTLVAGPACVWLWLRGHGAAAAPALAGSLLVPIVWIIKECLAVGQIFSRGEALYYAFNPLALGVLAAVALQLALAELVLRRVRTRRWQISGAPVLVLAVLLLLGVAYAIAAQTYGVTAAHYAYLAGYRVLFGN
jgi:hypothetical protein